MPMQNKTILQVTDPNFRPCILLTTDEIKGKKPEEILDVVCDMVNDWVDYEYDGLYGKALYNEGYKDGYEESRKTNSFVS